MKQAQDKWQVVQHFIYWSFYLDKEGPRISATKTTDKNRNSSNDGNFIFNTLVGVNSW